MTYVVTFEDYVPSERHDGHPWLQARVEEAAHQDGPYTAIESFTLEPVDADPAEPQERDFTTRNAVRQSGWYRLVFVDGSGDEQAAEPLFHDSAAQNYMPSVHEVARLLRERTTIPPGVQAGTFTDQTTPKYADVDSLIAEEAGKLSAKFGPSVPAALRESARAVIRHRVAMLIELTYFASQIRADRSPYQELKKLYDEALADFLLEREQLGSDGIPGSDDDLSSGGNPAVSDGGPSWGEVCW